MVTEKKKRMVKKKDKTKNKIGNPMLVCCSRQKYIL